MISICVILAAPCRLLVPMQSLPVSPPPMTNTCLPLAFMRSSLLNACPPRTRFCWASISNAKCMPLRLRPGMSRSRACGVRCRCSRHRNLQAGVPRRRASFVLKVMPSAAMTRIHATVYDGLVEFEVRDTEAQQPSAAYSSFSNTVTSYPMRFSWLAAAMPAGPEPTTATFFPFAVSSRLDVTFAESCFDDGRLVLSDGNRSR